MKRIFTIIAIALGLVLPMQAQHAPFSKEIKAEKGIERKMIRKAPTAATDITINDIVGTYDAMGYTAFEGKEDPQWTVTITADENDANKVWIQPFCTFLDDFVPVEYINPVYATFNAEKGTLTMPLGQVVFEGEGRRIGTATTTRGTDIVTTGDIEMSISKSTEGVVIKFAEQYYVGIGNLDNMEEWWFQAICIVTYTKIETIPYVYIYNKNVERPTRIQASQLYFNEIYGEPFVTTTREYNEDDIEGVYQAYAESGFNGYPAEEWTVTITRDKTEADKVWIESICMFGGLDPQYILPVYAYFDQMSGILSIPLGQVVFEDKDYRMIIGAASDASSVDITGNFLMEYGDNVLYSESGRLFGVGNTKENNGWWYQAIYDMTYSKEIGQVFALSEIDRITRVQPESNEDFAFIKPGQYTWTYGVPVSETELGTFTSNTTFTDVEFFDLSELFQDVDGLTGINWSITGLFEEIGIYEGGTAHPLAAISFVEDPTYEVLLLLDLENEANAFFSSIGTLPIQDQYGNSGMKDIFIGDFDGTAISQPAFVAMEQNQILFAGDQIALFYSGDDGYAYLYAYIYDVSLAPSTDAAAPKRSKVVIDTTVQGTRVAINKTPILRK